MVYQTFLTVVWALTVTNLVMAFFNPEVPRAWAWLIFAGGVFGCVFLLIFFMTQLCLWNVVLNCPVLL